MKNRLLSVLLGAAAIASLAGTAALGGTGAYAGVARQNMTPSPMAGFADPAFERVWERTDRPVAFGQVGRTWFWGPNPRQVVNETFAEGPNGLHKVQYFDKSRMEINDPTADPTSQFFVTNGLLTVELVAGRMQMGIASWEDRYPANINISGDFDDPNAPTYASFRAVANVAPGVGRRDQNRMGQPVIATIDRAGNLGTDSTKISVEGVNVAYYEATTGHNIPAKFWNFLNQSGPVYENGNLGNEQLIQPWFYASGLPVSDAYWAKVRIAGVQQDVLIQAFERRVLTYVPTNAPAWQVEMGNIGLHYYDWRYNNAGRPAGGTAVATGTAGTAVATGTAVTTGTAAAATTTATIPASPVATNTRTALSGKIAFVSERSGNQDIWMMNADGTVPQNLTNSPAADFHPSWSPDGAQLAFASTGAGGNTHIYILNMSTMSMTQVTTGTHNNQHPTWAPNGQALAFSSNREGDFDIWTANLDGSNLRNITRSPGSDTDPDWGSSNKIAFASDRNGETHIYWMNPDGTAVTRLSDRGPHNFLPTWSPDSRRILFISDRTGNANNEVWVMEGDGSRPVRLTEAQSAEYDPAWSPDGTRFVFASDRDGNMEIYLANADGSISDRLTREPSKDYQPTWKK